MTELPDHLADRLFRYWDEPGFEQVLQQSLAENAVEWLDIQRSTTQGGYVGSDDISVTLLTLSGSAGRRAAKIGVFFTETVGGCNCADDPFTVNGYCQRRVLLDPTTRSVSVEDAGD